MTDVPGEGFQVGAAFVQVSPEAEDFQGEVEALVTGADVVVTVPVVPDGQGFQARLEAEVTAGDTAVAVPVVPDASGFQMLLQQDLSASQERVVVPVIPDTTGFIEKVRADIAGADTPVEVPIVPSTTGFTSTVEAEAATAGKEARTAFRDEFAAGAGEQLSLFDIPAIDAEAGIAGEEAGTTFREKFTAGAGEQLSLFDMPAIEAQAAAAGETAAATVRGKLAEIPGQLSLFDMPAVEAEAATAGEMSATGFGDRFRALLGKSDLLSTAIPGLEAEAGAAGDASGKSFGSKMKAALMGDMSLMEVALGAGFIAATAIMASKFQSAMERIHTQAGVAQDSIKGLSSDVLGLASQVGESPDSLAAALYHIESSFQSVGITGSKAMDLLRIASEGARVGGANLVDVTNALDAVIASGIGGVKNYSQAMGALNAIVGAGDMTMQDLANAMGSGLMAVAKSYGQTLPEVGAALATFGDNNIRGAKAATDLRMAMQAILSPVAAGAAALQHLGLTTSQLGDTMEHHGLTAAIAEFVKHLEDSKVPMNEWGTYVTEIFGKRAGVGIGVLIDQLSRLQGKFPDIQKGAENFGNAWQQTQATVSQKLHDLEGGFGALMVRIGGGLLPILGTLFSDVTSMIPAIEHFGAALLHVVSPIVTGFFTGLGGVLRLLFGPLRDVTIGIGALALAWGAVKLVMKTDPLILIAEALITVTGLIMKSHSAMQFVSTWGPIFAAVAIPVAAAAAGMIAFDAATAAVIGEGVIGTLVGWGYSFVQLAVDIGSVVGAEGALGAATLALEAISPVGWAVAAAAAIGGLGYVLLQNTSTVDGYIQAQQKATEATGYNITGYQKLAQSLSQPIDMQTKLGKAVMGTATSLRIAKDGGAAYQPAMDQVTAAAKKAAETASKLGSAMKGVGNTYGITEKQAIGLAQAAGIQAKAWTGSSKAADQARAKLQQYVLTNEHALPKQQEENALMQVFGNNASTSSQQVTALDTSFKLLVGDFVGKQEAILNASSAVQQFGQDAASSGANSVTAQQGFYGAIDAIGQMGDVLTKAHTPMSVMYSDIEAQIQALKDKGPLNDKEKTALQGLQEWADKFATSTHGLTSKMLTAANTMESQFTPQLVKAGVQGTTAKNDVDTLTNAIIQTGRQSTATHTARQQMIDDLEHSGVKADKARRLVDGYIQRLAKIPKTAKTDISVSGDGKWSVHQVGGIYPTPSGKAPNPLLHPNPPGAAAGMLVRGGIPGKDSVLISAAPGELVVPVPLVNSGAVDHLRGAIPGFALGGVVSGGFHGAASGAGRWADSEWVNTNSAIVASVETAIANAINSKVIAAKAAASAAAHAGPAGHVSGSAGQVQSLAQRMAAARGWTGALWNDLNAVEMREAGWNLNARNPGSGAYGIAQFISGPGEYAQYGGNSGTAAGQVTGFLNYVAQRYGTPAGALAHEIKYGWYDQGGFLMPGTTMAQNNTGQPEMILPPSVGEALTSGSGPIARLAQTIANPAGNLAGVNKALTDQGAPMAYLTRTLTNPGGPMAGLQKAIVNPGGPIAKLGKTVADPGGPIAKLGKGVTDPGGPMATVGEGVSSGGTVSDLATALDNSDGPMLSLADALDSYVAVHSPGHRGHGHAGSTGHKSGGGHPIKAIHPGGSGHDHKSGGGHTLKGHHPADGGSTGSGVNPGGPSKAGDPHMTGTPVYNITVNYNGHKPSPEDHQAAMLRLSAAIGVA